MRKERLLPLPEAPWLLAPEGLHERLSAHLEALRALVEARAGGYQVEKVRVREERGRLRVDAQVRKTLARWPVDDRIQGTLRLPRSFPLPEEALRKLERGEPVEIGELSLEDVLEEELSEAVGKAIRAHAKEEGWGEFFLEWTDLTFLGYGEEGRTQALDFEAGIFGWAGEVERRRKRFSLTYRELSLKELSEV